MVMKKIFGILVAFLFIINVKANRINSIDMDIDIDKNGTAYVTEVWDVYVNEGTEVYKPYYNLGNSEFLDFKVRDENTTYTTLNNWNTGASFEAKKYKSGINYLDDGIELCFGISEYGYNTYVMNYTITNFIAKLNDADMLYWTLIPYELSNAPDQVSIKINTYDYLDEEIPVWGFGNYGGTAYVYDERIEVNSDGRLDSDEYMTVLVKFPKDYFDNDNYYDANFEDYLEMAQEGATAYNKTKESIISIIFSIISVFIPIFFVFLTIGLALKNSNKYLSKQKGEEKIPKDIPYFRDIPCNKNIYTAFFLSNEYGLMKNKNDFFGALILYFYKNKLIDIIKKGSTYVVNGKEKKAKNNVIVLKTKEEIESLISYDKEKTLYNYMIDASYDGYLENDEFGLWCNEHYSKIDTWFNDILNDEKSKLKEAGLVVVEQGSGLLKSTKYIATTKVFEMAKELAGLKKFLKDFSKIDDRTVIEVTLWEEYLIYAQIFGIAKQVAKDLKRLIPEVITENVYDDYIFFYNFSYNNMSRVETARNRAMSYSSGGGGFSSGGGGGGSFGGGGGGGGFR